MKALKILLILLLLGGASAATVMYSGIVNVAADEPHSDIVYWLLEETREASIKKSAQHI